jgi:signal transduction histidine kinase
MVLAVMAVQAQAFLQVWLFADPEVRLVGARWMIEQSRQASALFERPASERAEAARHLSRAGLLRVTWTPGVPAFESDAAPHPELSRLAATMQQALGSAMSSTRVWSSRLEYIFPIRNVRVVVMQDAVSGPPSQAPLEPGEADFFVPASVRVGLQGPDRSWIVVAPIAFEDTGAIGALPITPLLAGALIIALASILTTRRILAPLDRLIAAAARVGQSGSFVPVRKDGLEEFTGVAAAMEEMQRRLLRFVDERTQVLAAISHDLRSALTRLSILVERRQHGSDGDAMQAEIADMHGMLESTLAFAGGEAFLPPDRSVDLAALLISLVDDMADLGRPCSYEGPNHATVFGHPLSLKRAFSNLVDNAVKYGRSARVIVQADDDAVRVRVEDDGPGIPPERRQEALAPFRRLDPARSGAIPGAGLGLTIARDVVSSHGGSFSLDATATGSLSVRVLIPCKRGSEASGAGSGHDGSPFASW